MSIAARRYMYKWRNSGKVPYVLALACVVFLFSGFFSIGSNSRDSKDTTAPTLASRERTNPVRIIIPSIGVDAPVKPVGLTSINTMESPSESAETAWFKLGPSPGEKGSSVIAGHRGGMTRPAIFNELDRIQPGDTVYVEDEKGNTLAFVVREMREYDADEIVPEVWGKEDGTHLNLITCSGNWNILMQASEKRLVVFTDLIT